MGQRRLPGTLARQHNLRCQSDASERHSVCCALCSLPFSCISVELKAHSRTVLYLLDLTQIICQRSGLPSLLVPISKVLLARMPVCVQVYDTVTKNLMTPSKRQGETASLSNAQRVAAGCLSGASACIVVFPLETLRTQAAMGQRQMKGAGAYFTLAADIIRCANN